MIKIKRLSNLKLLREKNLNKISKEINTLNDEVIKCNMLEDKLIKIKDNSKLDSKYKNSWNIKLKYDFDIKIIEQISICKNRIYFLEKELQRAKKKLGSIILQKNIIEEKIKMLSIKDLNDKEEKKLRDMPYYRKN
tara:strand:- start:73 stop:480 length:408 start_codon:yes stop_codon:yes gene_type:complete